MVMTTPIHNLAPAEQFKALRAQIPVIEMAECTTEELLEPYPTNGLKWIKASRLALLIFSLFAIVTIGLTTAAFGRLKVAQNHIGNQSPQLIIAAAQHSQALKDPAFKKYFNSNPPLLALTGPALRNCIQWSIERGPIITVTCVLQDGADPLDTLTTLDKGMAAAGYVRLDQKDASNNQHIVTYGPK
jgi:hypothetical protein